MTGSRGFCRLSCGRGGAYQQQISLLLIAPPSLCGGHSWCFKSFRACEYTYLGVVVVGGRSSREVGEKSSKS